MWYDNIYLICEIFNKSLSDLAVKVVPFLSNDLGLISSFTIILICYFHNSCLFNNLVILKELKIKIIYT